MYKPWPRYYEGRDLLPIKEGSVISFNETSGRSMGHIDCDHGTSLRKWDPEPCDRVQEPVKNGITNNSD